MDSSGEHVTRRNPYLILGVSFGVDSNVANKAFARASRAARRGDSRYSTEDLTWALHQVEHAATNPNSLLDHFRVPANPSVYMDDLETTLTPAATIYPRRTDPGPCPRAAAERVLVERTVAWFLDDGRELPGPYGISTITGQERPRWFSRRWEEPRGDSLDAWGAATYYFETGEDGRPTRQVETYDAGPALRYGPGHEDDEYGGLGQARLDEYEDWTPWSISREAFEAVWGAVD